MADDIMRTRQGRIRCPMTRYVIDEHQWLQDLFGMRSHMHNRARTLVITWC